MTKSMLQPAAVLVAWSLLMLLWLARTRFAALAGSEIDLKTARPGGRGQDLEPVLPPKVMWKSHNYTHLMEQPTLFYAVIMIFGLTAGAGRTDVMLAWAYVGLRIAHSLWQAAVNTIPVRLTLFTLSTGCLVALSVRALLITF